MNSERAFLKAIAESPDDQQLRYVFADWLEEKGDQRAELVRIEEQSKSLALWSDEYWGLKSRRNELRKSCKPKFLKTLNYGQRYEPVFANCPEDALSRWRLIREFTERFFNLELPDVGREPSDIDEIQLVPRDQIPVSIVEWMSFTEDIAGTPAASMLRDGRSIADFAEHDSISLNLQAEGDVHWAVARRNMHDPDPLVNVYFLDYSAEPATFELRGEDDDALRTSEFALSFMLSYLYPQFGASVDDKEDLFRTLSEADGVTANQFGGLFLLEGSGWIGVMPRHLDAFGFGNSITIATQKTVKDHDLPKSISNLR